MIPAEPEPRRDFIIGFHDLKPGATEATFGRCRTPDGRSSYEVLCDAAGPLTGKTIVDLACGSGPLVELLASRVGAGGKVIGVDLSEGELKAARAKTTALGNIVFLREGAQKLSIAAASADAVLCHLAFMLFDPIEPVVSEVARVLKPGGVFAAVLTAWKNDPLLAEMTGAMAKLVAEERGSVPELGDARVREPDSLRLLFGRGFSPGMKVETFELLIEDSPDRLASRFLDFFYLAALLSEDGKRRLKDRWQEMLSLRSEGTVVLRLPLLIFSARKL